MSSLKKLILYLDQDRIILPRHLLPDGVKRFEFERRKDGSIVLRPQTMPSDADDPVESSDRKQNSAAKKSQVIDFQRASAIHRRQEEKKKPQKHRIDSETHHERKERFVKLHLFRSRLEAEMVGEILKQSGIPFFIQSEDIGIFGPGASPAPGGARLIVRQIDLEEAKHVLAGLF
ncbi:MAG: hypothetical protein ACE5GK_08850 [Nitrospiria bacterium]